MSESVLRTRGRSARTVIEALGGSVTEKMRVNVKGGLFESEKVGGAESMAVILGGGGRYGRVVKVTSLSSPTSVQGILVGDGVGISPVDHSVPLEDRASNDSSLADSQCVMEFV